MWFGFHIMRFIFCGWNCDYIMRELFNIKKYKGGLNVRIAIFIDAANKFGFERHLRLRIDLEALDSFILNKYKNFSPQIKIKKFFTPIEKGNDWKKNSYISKIRGLHYEIITQIMKNVRTHNRDAEGNPIFYKKCDMDARIGFEIGTSWKQFDTLVFICGDSDFASIMEILVKKKKKIFIIASRNSIAKELIALAVKYDNMDVINFETEEKIIYRNKYD